MAKKGKKQGANSTPNQAPKAEKQATPPGLADQTERSPEDC